MESLQKGIGFLALFSIRDMHIACFDLKAVASFSC